jgi:polyisoprenoid-binding protein YceI
MAYTKKTRYGVIALVGAMGTIGGLAGWSTNGSEAGSSTIIERASASTAGTRLYEIDPTHTNVIFKIRHSTVSSFYGRFNTTQGTINFDKDNIEGSSMEVTVQMSSIDTHNRVRDGHLKGADFFNVRQYAQAKFVSSGIKKKSEGVYVVTGDFTLQGKTVVIEAELHDLRTGKFNNFDMLGVEARFTINRSEFGITKHYNAADPENGPLGDRVEIIVGIEAIGK